MKKLLLLSLFAIAAPLLVEAQTFTVNVLSQGSDNWNGCTNTFTDATPTTGSFVEGLARLNNGTATVIEFAIPGTAPFNINISGVNPEICAGVTTGLIDGNTQAGVVITGPTWATLRISSSNVTVRGLEFNGVVNIRGTGNTLDNCTITSSASHGIQIDNGATNNTVSNTTITGVPQKGIEISGATTTGNIIDNVTITGLGDDAIYVNGASNTQITGCTLHTNEQGVNAQNAASLSVEDCFVYNHNKDGIYTTGSNNASFSGNYVGLNAAGQKRPNGLDQDTTTINTANIEYAGLHVNNSTQVSIINNVVSGNAGHGILYENSTNAPPGAQIYGNKVGVDPTGMIGMGNFGQGILVLDCERVNIGSAGGNGNQVCANGNRATNSFQTSRVSGHGIELRSSSFCTVAGNLVGTDVSGNATSLELGNQLNGIYINGSLNNNIGGPNAGEENVVCGNGFAFEDITFQPDGFPGVRHGIQLHDNEGPVQGNVIIGNHVGVGADGTTTTGLGNRQDGISLLGYSGTANATSNNTIGGTSAADANIIVGNAWGIFIQGPRVTNNSFIGNYIGTLDVNGASVVPNIMGGFTAQSEASNNIIGTVASPNVIAHHSSQPIQINGADAVGNTIQGNKLMCNTGTGIMLNSGGNIEYGPVHFNVSEDRPGFISGFTPNVGDRVDIYINDDCNNKVTCQEAGTFGVTSNTNHAGLTHVNNVTSVTDNLYNNDDGWALWEYDISSEVTATFNNVVITATDAAGNTSEFHTCISITNCDPPTDLTVSTPDDEICTGETTTITATPVGEAGTDYQFTLYEGSVGGTLIAGPQDDSVFTVNASGNYYVLVQDKRDLAACTIDNTGDPVVITLFDTPSNLTISGDDVVCFGEDGVQYNAAPAGGGFTYTWTVPTGTSLTGQGTDQITVDFGTAAAGNKIISVQGNNNGCLGAIDEFDVAVRALPTGQSIDGATSVCASSSGLYTADPNNITSTYSWSIVSGPATIATDASSTDGEVTLDFGATAGTVNLQFTETDADLCTSAAPTTLAITVNALPVVSAIQGPDSLCENELGNYSVSGAGLTYDWTVVNGSPTVGTGSSLSITAGTAGTLEISVSATNNTTTCESAVPSTKSVTVNALPLALTISGEDTICAEETDITYSVDTPNPNSTYQWTVTNGAAITLGNGTDNIVVDFVSPSVTTGTGSVAVTETNEFGCANTSPDAIFPIEVFGLPTDISITGDDKPVCQSAGNVYAVTGTAGSTFNWMVPTNSVITAGDGTESITVTFSNLNGSITVTEVTAAGCAGTQASLPINLQNCALNANFEISVDSVCQGNEVTITDRSTGEQINSWTWDFGVGATPAVLVETGSTASPHQVSYATPGIKTITLTITNNLFEIADTSFTVEVNALPQKPILDEPTEVCDDTDNVVFAVENPEAGAFYSWAVFTDGSVSTISSGRDTAWVDFGNTDASADVRVITNLEGCRDTTTLTVLMNDRPETGDISGDSIVCSSDNGVIYSVPNNVGSTYAWTVPTGATIASGDGTNEITVDFGTTGGQITVLETNSSGCADITGVSSFNVSVEAVPSQPGISGPASVCVGDQETYTVNGNAGSTYEWLNVPSTATDTTGNTVSITFPDNPSVDALVVREITEFGCESEIAQLTITSNTLPADLEIEGSEFGCEGQSFVYSVNNTTGSTYDWTVTGSASVVSTPNDSSSVEIEFGSQSTLITVTETNAAGCSSAVPATKSVDITPNVGSLSFSVPQGQVCDANSELVYNVTITATNATSFGLVSDPVDALIIESDNGSGVYTVSFDPDHVGPIKLFGTAENECTTQGPREVPITIEESMEQQVDIMTSPVCAGSVATFVATLSTADQKGDFTWFYNGDTIVDQSDDTLMVSQISGVDIVQGDTFTVVSNASICIWEDLSDLSADTTAHILDLPTAIAYAQSEEDKDFYDLDELIFDNIVSVPIVNLIGSDKIEDPGSTEGDDVTYQWNYWNDEVTQDSLITLELTGSTEINASIVPPRDETTFFLTVDNGVCTSTNSVKVVLDFEIFIPDAFSPNGDDSYEEWAIKNIERFPGTHIQVYNRWGNLVYDNIEDAGGSLEPWKGTHDGKDLPMGTYFYIVDLKIEGREAYRKDVSILR